MLHGLVAIAAFAVVLEANCARVCADESPKPAKKDSIKAIKPKSVVLTPTVEPAEARPGETVTYKVTAKLNPGYHIYKYSKEKGGPGPVSTSFDFFDTGGLKIEGDWSPSKDPEKHKDPNFPEVEVVEFHDAEVTWSVKLKVPDGLEPGRKILRCQARYQVCDAKQCSIPGNWTLPEVELTVLGGGGQASAPTKAAETSAAATTAAEPLKPASKDSSAAFKPKTVVLTPSVEPQEARPGETITYKVAAKIEPGFHIYKYSKEAGEAGVSSTNFDFFDTGGLKIEGDWMASNEPEKHSDPSSGGTAIVEYHEGDVTWSLKLKVPEGTQPGKRVLRCQAGYQVCDDKQCSIPGKWTLPDVELLVLSGEAGAPRVEPALAVAKPAAPQALVATSTTTEVSEVAPKAAAAPVAAAAAARAPEASGEPTNAKVQSEIAQRAQQGLIPFLLASALGGLFALVMPCVWPMVPITVNFFVKQGQGKGGRKKATELAIIYCLAIVGIFTSVGVLFSFFFSAASLQTLANNPWLNLGVAALFVAFGLSLLGLFELRLPNFLLNASAQGESRGGLVGVVFMALTLTITSFTCTFPVVGGLLVMAAGGDFFYPIVGLATFSAVIALPFFLLALSPGLISKMPRSGDWMNAVKVVGGLVEIGAAFKFVNTAELAWVTPENAWFDAQVVLTAWVILSAVCGIYLLGIFRTDHDHDEVKVGPGRLVTGALFLGLALYMLPALFGRPPASLVWDRLIVGILPPDSSELTAAVQVAGGGDGSVQAPVQEVRATSPDPAEAERQEKKAHGVLWGMSFDQAREIAAAEKKPILIDFTGVNCANCRLMERRVLPRPDVVSILKKFVTVQLYTDFVPIGSISATQRKELAETNQARIVELVQEQTNPFYVVLSPSGEVLGRLGGYNDPPAFVSFLTKALEKVAPEVKVTQAEQSASPATASAGSN
jgi:thiol:disulfide interchange protein DsbD